MTAVVMTKLFHIRRILYVFILACFLYGIFQLMRAQFSLTDSELERNNILRGVALRINSSHSAYYPSSGQACRHPNLDVRNKDIMKYMKDVPPIDCGDKPDWVEIIGNMARIKESAKKGHGEVECSFTDIVRESDSLVSYGLTTTTHTDYTLEGSDFVKVRCHANGKKWRNIMSGVRRDDIAAARSGWSNLSPEALGLNVLIWGHDSLSRNTFLRKLPLTSQYLQNNLNALTLEGYNIVGDGTPQALIPILTGKTELELPEARKRMGEKANYVNIYPFVWNEFRKNGYVTAYAEDCPSIGTFTYRLKGFSEPPTDHYMRPFFVAASPDYGGYKKYCLGSLPRHKIMMNYARDFFDVYRDKPKFMFSFHSELSHDSYNMIGAVDKDLKSFFEGLHSSGHLNNTLLIVMSDHGHRFAQIRDTQQGKQEERLPMFSFVFPPWFENKYPEAMANFRVNTRRLTTPFDINPTLKDVLHFQGAGKGSLRNRSISLFKEVPSERTCSDASIEAHWCACLSWEELPVSSLSLVANPLSTAALAANALVDYINKLTEGHRTRCHPLKTAKLVWAAKLLPGGGLLHFRKNADTDGFVPDLSAQTEVTQEIYQVKVETQPGAGRFEASLQYDVRENSFTVKVEDISRINKYGRAAHCIEADAENLRKFCYCRVPPPVAA
ncbi:uncharacterized protein LOC124161034 [Ischnura elegans]|uniref:uncharacterized protein LOC124161034 n=1 Tax=Ischnura elegans TaxID=197161 RepID=UPI001ED89D96|nr:uncharacterized protein LOC124161034 [Ischnura elegans]